MPEPQDIPALREVAETATPRGWEPRPGKFGSAVASGRTRFGEHYIANNIPTQADAEHIATFDPPTILALLSEVERGRALRAAVEALHDDLLDEIAERREDAPKLGDDDRPYWIHFTAGMSEVSDRLAAALLAAHVPSPLPVGGAAGAGEVGT